MYNSPATSFQNVNSDLGLFAQDAWTPRREISVVGGLRAEAYTDYGFKVSPRIAATYLASVSGSGQPGPDQACSSEAT